MLSCVSRTKALFNFLTYKKAPKIRRRCDVPRDDARRVLLSFYYKIQICHVSGQMLALIQLYMDLG
jgi:hypothetical protein